MGKALNEEAVNWKTGLFQISDAPSPHSLLYEHVKTIVTLSIAFLGFSVGFAEKLVQLARFPSGPEMLWGVWGLLVSSIILVLLAAVNLHRYLLLPPNLSDPKALSRYKGIHNRSVIQIGLAGVCLATAAGLFAVFGGFVLLYSEEKVDASTAIRRAIAFLSSVPGLTGVQWQVDSISWEETNKLYKLSLMNAKSNERYLVSVRKTDGEAISFTHPEAKSLQVYNKEPQPIPFSVRDVQRRLLDVGYSPGPIDGVIGRRTLNAIKEFQKDYELPATGYLDKDTLGRLGITVAHR